MTIKDKFIQLRDSGKKAFIAYVPFGYPEPSATKGIILSLISGGADVIELGLPFSDPLADGPIIQKATHRALCAGANLNNLFVTLSQLRRHLTVPLVIMTYYNPVFKFGMSDFLAKIKRFGVSGIMVVDLPIEESRLYLEQTGRLSLEPVFFVTPTTSERRAEKIVQRSKGFIYYISVTGTTGFRRLSYVFLRKHIAYLKKITELPVCVGFGVHTASQVARINSFSDGVVVGSAIVKFIEENYRRSLFYRRLADYIKLLKGTP